MGCCWVNGGFGFGFLGQWWVWSGDDGALSLITVVGVSRKYIILIG